MNTDLVDRKHPELSIVIPFYNEQESLQSVCEEVAEVISSEYDSSWELIMVDDGSNDGTAEIMDHLSAEQPFFRTLHLQDNCGQSAALQAGFFAARGRFIATLDGDGQNDPRDLPHLLQVLTERNLDMICGIRQKRADNLVRKISSRLANRVRSAILQDNITDVGCSLRVFRRECFLRIPFFRNAHRFFPALFQMNGFSVDEIPVNHRPRSHGTSKYGGGINSRLWAGLADLAGAFWLKKRSLNCRLETKDNN